MDQGVFHPWLRAFEVGGASPQIDDEFAAEYRSQRGSLVDSALLVRSEQRFERFEALIAEPVYLPHSAPSGETADVDHQSTKNLLPGDRP